MINQFTSSSVERKIDNSNNNLWTLRVFKSTMIKNNLKLSSYECLVKDIGYYLHRIGKWAYI